MYSLADNGLTCYMHGVPVPRHGKGPELHSHSWARQEHRGQPNVHQARSHATARRRATADCTWRRRSRQPTLR